MTPKRTVETFGDVIPVCRMNQMARDITSSIGTSKSETFAGFVWYRPQSLVQQNLVQENAPDSGRLAA